MGNITTLPPTNITTLPPTNVTTLPPTTECEGVVDDKESLEFCEKKKDKNKCEQFKMDCLVTCGFCNPNITTNVTTLPPTNVTTFLQQQNVREWWRMKNRWNFV